LAAGQSRRFGGNKLLHRFDGEQPMVVAAARQLRAVLPDTLAVVADARGEVADLLRQEGLQVIANPRAGQGMGTSIACAVAARPDAAAWLIALADMPCIARDTIRTVVHGLAAGGGIVAPVYRGRRGHPVGFAARYAPLLMQLDADRGARAVVAANRESLHLVEVGDPGVLRDIDR
jgi:molybdenum cofactor cytidylyltransferase